MMSLPALPNAARRIWRHRTIAGLIAASLLPVPALASDYGTLHIDTTANDATMIDVSANAPADDGDSEAMNAAVRVGRYVDLVGNPVYRPIRLAAAGALSGAFNRPGIPLSAYMTSPYGRRRHPISGAMAFHHGIDLAAPTGTSVATTAAGRVLYAGWMHGYGQLVVIDHLNGLQTRYAHLSAINVIPGQSVTSGSVIGRVGSTGNATGPHLHYEVRSGYRSLNPLAAQSNRQK